MQAFSYKNLLDSTRARIHTDITMTAASIQISTRIPEVLLKRVKKLMDRDDVKFQAAVRQALELWAAKQEGKAAA